MCCRAQRSIGAPQTAAAAISRLPVWCPKMLTTKISSSRSPNPQQPPRSRHRTKASSAAEQQLMTVCGCLQCCASPDKQMVVESSLHSCRSGQEHAVVPDMAHAAQCSAILTCFAIALEAWPPPARQPASDAALPTALAAGLWVARDVPFTSDMLDQWLSSCPDRCWCSRFQSSCKVAAGDTGGLPPAPA